MADGFIFMDDSNSQAAQVQMVHQIAPGVPVIVYGDPTRLRQVLVNLLTNR